MGPGKDIMLGKALQNRGAIMGLIFSMVRDPAVAEDIFQDVIVAIAESDKIFDSDKEFLAWSWGVARNIVRRHWALVKRNPDATDPSVLETVADAIVEEVDPDVWRQEKHFLRECMKNLPARTRKLFMHRYADNLKGPALAEKAGVSIGSLRTTLLRVRRSLRRCIESRARQPIRGGEIA